MVVVAKEQQDQLKAYMERTPPTVETTEKELDIAIEIECKALYSPMTRMSEATVQESVNAVQSDIPAGSRRVDL
jgi:hypothetical protein